MPTKARKRRETGRTGEAIELSGYWAHLSTQLAALIQKRRWFADR